MNKNMYIKKYRNVSNNGTVYNLIWESRIDDERNGETILSKDVNPISEEYVKHMLVVKAAHKNLDSFLATVAESLSFQEGDK